MRNPQTGGIDPKSLVVTRPSRLMPAEADGIGCPSSPPEAALWWHRFGFAVIPIVPGEKRPAVKKFDWLDGLSEAAIRQHWSFHPDHEVGAILDEHHIVLDADTSEALDALAELEQRHGIVPSLVIKTQRGEHHHFRLIEGTYAKSDSHSTADFAERLDVRAVPSSILLTPSKNKAIARLTANRRAGMVAVGQDFIDAVFRHNGREVPRPNPEWIDDVERPAGNVETGALAQLLDWIDPDCGYQDWLNVLMAVYHETGGSSEGFDLALAWSQRGRKFGGRDELNTKWESFSGRVSQPIKVGTLIMMAKAGGADVSSILNADSFRPCATVVIKPTEDELKNRNLATNVSPLLKYSLTGQSAKYLEMAQKATPLLGDLCLLGEASVWYAKHNTGKTLITLHLIMEAIEGDRIAPDNVFLINADDSSLGLAEKMAFLDELGAHTLVPGQRGLKPKDLIHLLQEAANNGAARGTLVIIDTLKKFVNLMDKRHSSEFANVCRQFVAAGGTILGLAHINKRRSDDGKAIFAGTTDILDDFDAGYIIDEIGLDTSTGEKIVEFVREKGRGGGAQRAAYSYAAGDGLTYAERLASVKRVDLDKLDEFKRTEEQRSDADIIASIERTIISGVNSKMKIARSISEELSISRRKAVQVIERYTGEDPNQHRWRFTGGARGSMVFQLLSAPKCLQ